MANAGMRRPAFFSTGDQHVERGSQVAEGAGEQFANLGCGWGIALQRVDSGTLAMVEQLLLKNQMKRQCRTGAAHALAVPEFKGGHATQFDTRRHFLTSARSSLAMLLDKAVLYEASRHRGVTLALHVGGIKLIE